MMLLCRFLNVLQAQQPDMDLIKDIWMELYVISVIPETVSSVSGNAQPAQGYYAGRADLLDSCGDVIRIEANVSKTQVNTSRDLRKQLVEKFPVGKYVYVKKLSTPTFKDISNVAATFQLTADIRTRLSEVHLGEDSEQLSNPFQPMMKTMYCHFASDVLQKGRQTFAEGKDAPPRCSIIAVLYKEMLKANGIAPAVYKVITNDLKCELVSCCCCIIPPQL
jgi:hypothetical protein